LPNLNSKFSQNGESYLRFFSNLFIEQLPSKTDLTSLFCTKTLYIENPILKKISKNYFYINFFNLLLFGIKIKKSSLKTHKFCFYSRNILLRNSKLMSEAAIFFQKDFHSL